MKRKISLLLGTLSLFLALALTACGQGKDSKEEGYQIYYLERGGNRIEPVLYKTQTPKENTKKLAEELLQQMMTQVEDIDYVPVISGFSVKDCLIRERQITLNLSEEYKMLEPTKEVLSRAAFVKTLCQLEGIELINIQVNGRNLTDNLGHTVGVMSQDQFIDNTGEDMKKYEPVTLTLYFANRTGDKLIKVNRSLRYNTNISMEKLVVEQLLSGPVEQKNKLEPQTIFPTLDPATKIIGVNIKDGICYVNLDQNFLSLLNNVSTDVAIYSMVNSLTELPGVLKVQIAIEGKTEIKFGEKQISSTLFERNLDLIQTEEGKEN